MLEVAPGDQEMFEIPEVSYFSQELCLEIFFSPTSKFSYMSDEVSYGTSCSATIETNYMSFCYLQFRFNLAEIFADFSNHDKLCDCHNDLSSHQYLLGGVIHKHHLQWKMLPLTQDGNLESAGRRQWKVQVEV